MENKNVVQTIVHAGQEPTESQIRQVEAAVLKGAMPDEEAPELTEDQYRQLAELAKKRRVERVKPVVSLRISPDTLKKAKATGKGYTGFLSRLLDNAINDPDMVEKSL